MKLELDEFIKILEEIATDFMNENRALLDDGSYTVPSYDEFAKHLIQNFGVDGNNQIVDQEKWLAYILTRT